MALPIAAPSAAFAQTEEVPRKALPAVPDRFHADAEIDLTAYILKGFSIHVGLGWQRWRLDLGSFAMAVPRFVHGNADYEVSFDVYGAKLQYVLFAEQLGGFVGIDGGLNRLYLERKGTDLAARQTHYGIGVDVGWRCRITSGLYGTTWAGVSHVFNTGDVTLADSTYKAHPGAPSPPCTSATFSAERAES